MKLIKPVLTEKTYKLAQNGHYTFDVALDADKLNIKKALETKFNVNVVSVRMINRLGKVKIFGAKRKTGKRADTKRAIIKLKPKQTIDLFEIK